MLVTDWLSKLIHNQQPTKSFKGSGSQNSLGTARISPGQPGYETNTNNIIQGGAQPGGGGGGGGWGDTPSFAPDSNTGGGSGGYDPDAAAKSALIGDLQNKWNTLNSVFQGLFGKIDSYATDATNRLQQGYDTQQNSLIDQYNKTQNQTGSIYGARGLGDSSYLGDALGQNNQTFNNSLAEMGVNRDNQLAQIGQNVATQKAQLSAQQNAYAPYIQNLGQYGVSDLQGLQGNLQSAIGNAQVTGAGLGPQSDFVNSLNAITPLEQQGTAQLAAKLKNLTLSAAPNQAKKYIAQGLIKASTLNDANANNYWQNYFESLLNGAA